MEYRHRPIHITALPWYGLIIPAKETHWRIRRWCFIGLRRAQVRTCNGWRTVKRGRYVMDGPNGYEVITCHDLNVKYAHVNRLAKIAGVDRIKQFKAYIRRECPKVPYELRPFGVNPAQLGREDTLRLMSMFMMELGEAQDGK